MTHTNNPGTGPGVTAESIWDQSTKTQPLEVWLWQRNFEVMGRIAYEDERTDRLKVESLSMRGAQREVTGFLIQQGYVPASRWEVERVLDGEQNSPLETSRRFRPNGSSPNLVGPESEFERAVVSSPDELAEKGDFYVYENWTNTFALVHRGSCSFCNDGQGMQRRGTKTPNGQWRGSFPTLGDALKVAQNAADGHRNGAVWTVRTCGTCLRAKGPRPVPEVRAT